MTILDFCGSCGVLLRDGQVQEGSFECENCGVDLEPTDSRLQGQFEDNVATHLQVVTYGTV